MNGVLRNRAPGIDTQRLSEQNLAGRACVGNRERLHRRCGKFRCQSKSMEFSRRVSLYIDSDTDGFYLGSGLVHMTMVATEMEFERQ
jgi:hypothetical protein